MIDFKELPVDGNAFEQLVRELLFLVGHRAYWSGKGPDGGRDLLCEEELPSTMLPAKRRWMVQCKHNAHSGESVGVGELRDFVTNCAQHQADGFLLVCTTQPSSGVVAKLEGVTNNSTAKLLATYWDGVTLERMLKTPRLWPIAQRFFPKSAGSWQIFATDLPNKWIANFKGMYFYLANRIGSARYQFSLESIEARLVELGGIALPPKHFLRLRAVYYDDKNGGFTWFLDYLYPSGETPALTEENFLKAMKNNRSREDGQFYEFDIIFKEYAEHSDHFDVDHDDYYRPYVWNFHHGIRR